MISKLAKTVNKKRWVSSFKEKSIRKRTNSFQRNQILIFIIVVRNKEAKGFTSPSFNIADTKEHT